MRFKTLIEWFGNVLQWGFTALDYVSNAAAISFIICMLVGCTLTPKLPSTAPDGVSAVGQKIAAAVSGSPTHRAIQTAVNWQMTLCILGGVACLVFGGLAIYGGQVLPGVKLVAAGLLLPIAGIYWAYHWLLITCIVLVGLAVIFLLTHYALIQPALSSVEAWAKTVEARLIPAAKK
jgi:hypothetical protein